MRNLVFILFSVLLLFPVFLISAQEEQAGDAEAVDNQNQPVENGVQVVPNDDPLVGDEEDVAANIQATQIQENGAPSLTSREKLELQRAKNLGVTLGTNEVIEPMTIDVESQDYFWKSDVLGDLANFSYQIFPMETFAGGDETYPENFIGLKFDFKVRPQGRARIFMQTPKEDASLDYMHFNGFPVKITTRVAGRGLPFEIYVVMENQDGTEMVLPLTRQKEDGTRTNTLDFIGWQEMSYTFPEGHWKDKSYLESRTDLISFKGFEIRFESYHKIQNYYLYIADVIVDMNTYFYTLTQGEEDKLW